MIVLTVKVSCDEEAEAFALYCQEESFRHYDEWTKDAPFKQRRMLTCLVPETDEHTADDWSDYLIRVGRSWC